MDISVSLTPEMLKLVEAKLASGRYASASDVVGEALRLLERADLAGAEPLDGPPPAAGAGPAPLDMTERREAARRKLAETAGDACIAQTDGH